MPAESSGHVHAVGAAILRNLHYLCTPVALQLYLECHYLAHSNLIDSISEDSCRQLCLAVAPHVKQFYYWVGEYTSPLL